MNAPHHDAGAPKVVRCPVRAFDGLAITWFDQIQKNGVWKVCPRYRDMADRRFFSPEGDLNVYAETSSSASDQLAYQEALLMGES